MNAKRLYTVDERKAMAEAGEALPDGSYPIADEDDLKNAIQAFGRSKDPKQTKKHIWKRAKALGKLDLIPDEWQTKGGMSEDEMEGSEAEMVEDEETEMDEYPEMKKGAKAMAEDEQMETSEAEAVEDEETEAVEDAPMVEVSEDGEVKCAMGKDAKGGCGYEMGMKSCKSCGAMAKLPDGMMIKALLDELDDEDYDDEEDDLDEKGLPAAFLMQIEHAAKRSMDGSKDKKGRKENARKRRLASMGKEEKGLDDGSYLCGASRQILGANDSPCEGCAGGCVGSDSTYGLLEVEGLAEVFGKVLDSGYAPAHDLFIVDVKDDSGSLWQVAYTGNGDFDGLDPLHPDDLDLGEVIAPEDAVDIALLSVDGKALSIDVDILGGVEVYAVAIEGKDGYVHDVLIASDGTFLEDMMYKAESDEVLIKSDEEGALIADLIQFQAMVLEEELNEMGEI